jgi:hypothetical protein
MEGMKVANEIMIKLLETQANPSPIHISGKYEIVELKEEE